MRQMRRWGRGFVIGSLVAMLTVLGAASVGAQIGTISNTGADRTANNDSATRGTFVPGIGTGGGINTAAIETGADRTANNDSGSRGTFSPGIGTGGSFNPTVQDTGADRTANNDTATRFFTPGIGTGGR